MIVEVLVILAVLGTGVAILKAAGMQGWPTLPLGFVVGLAVTTAATFGQAILGLPTTPAVPLGILVVLAVGGWWMRCRLGGGASVDALAVAVGALGVAVLVGLLWPANLLTYHYDSVEYVTTGSLVGRGEFGSMSISLLLKRFSSIGLLNSLATMNGSFYLRSLAPLTALATLASLWWMLETGLEPFVRGRRIGPVGIARAAAGLGVAILVSSYGFLWQGFYLNGHLLFAVFMLGLVGAMWLLAIEADVPTPVLVVLATTCVVGATWSRGEAAFLVILALAPIALNASLAAWVRRVLVGTAAAALLLEQATLAVMVTQSGDRVPESTIGLLALGGVLLVTSAVVGRPWLERWARPLLWASEGILWLALAAFALGDQWILRQSLSALWENLVFGDGLWGLSLVTLVLLGAWALVRDAPQKSLLRFPVTAFVPLSLLLAYLREGGFRPGPFDSMNRIVLQVVPIAVLFVMVALSSDDEPSDVAWRPSRGVVQEAVRPDGSHIEDRVTTGSTLGATIVGARRDGVDGACDGVVADVDVPGVRGG